MKNELSIQKLGKLYKEQIDITKTLKNDCGIKDKSSISLKTKLVLSILTNLNDSNYCTYNNLPVTLKSPEIAKCSNNLFDEKAIRYQIRLMNKIEKDYKVKLIEKTDKGIIVNRNRNTKFLMVFNFNSDNPELNKPSMIFTISYLLEKSLLNYIKKGNYVVNSSELKRIRLNIGVTEKTFKNDLKTLNKYSLIEFENNEIILSNSLKEQHLLLVNLKLADKKNKLKQKNEIKKITEKHIEIQMEEQIENTRLQIENAIENLSKTAFRLKNSYQYTLEKTFGKIKANEYVGKLDFKVVNNFVGNSISNFKKWETFRRCGENI